MLSYSCIKTKYIINSLSFIGRFTEFWLTEMSGFYAETDIFYTLICGILGIKIPRVLMTLDSKGIEDLLTI